MVSESCPMEQHGTVASQKGWREGRELEQYDQMKQPEEWGTWMAETRVTFSVKQGGWLSKKHIKDTTSHVVIHTQGGLAVSHRKGKQNLVESGPLHPLRLQDTGHSSCN